MYLKDFNDGLLGGNYKKLGTASGEEYFEKIFNTKFQEVIDKNMTIAIDGTDTYGVPTTFIRTVIELTIETYGIIEVKKRFRGYYNNQIPESAKLKNEILNDTLNFYESKPLGFKHPDNLKYCKRYNLDKNTKTYE